MSRTAHGIAKSFGYLTAKEVTALKTLTEMLPENSTVLNIGAGAGTSSIAFLETRTDLTLHTVDIRQDSPLGSLQSELNAIKEANLDVKGRHYQYLGDSKEICKTMQPNMFDLVFIDGNHSRDGVRGDIKVVIPLLKENAIIAFDDYSNSPKGKLRWPEVKRAIDELVKPYYEMVLHEDSVIAFRMKK